VNVLTMVDDNYDFALRMSFFPIANGFRYRAERLSCGYDGFPKVASSLRRKYSTDEDAGGILSFLRVRLGRVVAKPSVILNRIDPAG
jgi:hypothetical protein